MALSYRLSHRQCFLLPSSLLSSSHRSPPAPDFGTHCRRCVGREWSGPSLQARSEAVCRLECHLCPIQCCNTLLYCIVLYCAKCVPPEALSRTLVADGTRGQLVVCSHRLCKHAAVAARALPSSIVLPGCLSAHCRRRRFPLVRGVILELFGSSSDSVRFPNSRFICSLYSLFQFNTAFDLLAKCTGQYLISLHFVKMVIITRSDCCSMVNIRFRTMRLLNCHRSGRLHHCNDCL